MSSLLQAYKLRLVASRTTEQEEFELILDFGKTRGLGHPWEPLDLNERVPTPPPTVATPVSSPKRRGGNSPNRKGGHSPTGKGGKSPTSKGKGKGKKTPVPEPVAEDEFEFSFD